MITRMFEIFGICVGGAAEVLFTVVLGILFFLFLPQLLVLILPLVGVVIIMTLIGCGLQVLWRIFF